MPGAPGGDQKMPPGVLPPPGLQSGGARTIMGATVTPPDDADLLVTYAYVVADTETTVDWQTCRRISPLESCVLLEGLNFEGGLEGAEKDVNVLLPFEGLVRLQWKYKAHPAPPPEETEAPEED
jgi:hypothetical protein